MSLNNQIGDTSPERVASFVAKPRTLGKAAEVLYPVERVKKKWVPFLKYCDLHGLQKQICYRVLPMPKVKLIFNLPEEDEEYKTCMAAGDLAVACEEVDNRCRALLKWAEGPSDDAVRLATEIRAALANVLCR